ncbi:ABC transporter ATP-binding protein [Brevibacterium sp. FME17]|uniref:ABC transporter ATP-binding protein n=1 Tax=Brevibacterium sp. FME17 TaxID=2742606 RepID=UPI0018677D18|nr:ABC transporter ATP-binding protein [Brevibacterium sp. FME17]
MSVLEIDRLSVKYGTRTVVSEVSLAVGRKQTVGLVGESGSGKSTIANAAVGLAPVRGGSIRVNGVDTIGWRRDARNARRRIQMIFQDPYSALDPKMSIGDSIAEATRATGRNWTSSQKRTRVRELLSQVHLDPDRSGELPGALSGGQRQRATIARALAGEPEVIIADEVTSALDVSVQSTVLNLLRELQDELGLSMLFISHNLAVVRYISDEICVMRDGKIVEYGETETLLANPAEAYTRDLLAAVPVLGERMQFDSEVPA